jgi:hypothetical protein
MTTLDIADRVIAQRKVKASALKPAPWNWRTHPEEQRAVMRGLLKEIGFAGAVLARELEDKSLELIDGHLRIEELGDREIAVTITDLTEDEAKALNLVHDPVGRLAGTDAAKLEELLQSVQFDDEALQKLTQDMTDLLGVIPETPPIGAGGDEFDATPIDAPGLPSGDKSPYQQMTFTLHDDQTEVVKSAIEAAKKQGPFVDTQNENSNGNALARIAEAFIGQG